MALQRAAVVAAALFGQLSVPADAMRAALHEEITDLRTNVSLPEMRDQPTAAEASSLAEAKVLAQVALAAGHVLRDRYVLHSFMHRQNLTSSAPRVGQDFPSYPSMGGQRNPINSYTASGHLGKGSFGDVWKALDQKTGQYVAVKIFYKGDKYVSKSLLPYYPTLAQDLEVNKQECQTIKDVVAQSYLFPQGAKHICQCIEHHINDGGANDPNFLVQEMCGSSLNSLFEKQMGANLAWDRQVMRGILNGISFLNRLNPPLIHHDLKLENVAVTDAGEAKIIDFGGLVPFTRAGQMGGAACTPSYAPPEAAHCPNPPNFAMTGANSWDYDTWAAGAIYYELICGNRNRPIPENRLCPVSHMKGPYLVTSFNSGVGSATDIQVITGLLQPYGFRTEPSVAALSLR